MKMKAPLGTAFLLCSYGWPIGLGTSFGMLEGTVSSNVTLSPFVILVCRGQGSPQQYILAVWNSFVHPRAFFLLGMGFGLDIKGAGVPRSFGPTVIIIETEEKYGMLTSSQFLFFSFVSSQK